MTEVTLVQLSSGLSQLGVSICSNIAKYVTMAEKTLQKVFI